jgi:hypothetical protein
MTSFYFCVEKALLHIFIHLDAKSVSGRDVDLTQQVALAGPPTPSYAAITHEFAPSANQNEVLLRSFFSFKLGDIIKFY